MKGYLFGLGAMIVGSVVFWFLVFLCYELFSLYWALGMILIKKHRISDNLKVWVKS